MYGYCGSELGVWQYQAALGLAKKKRTNKKVTSVPRRIETTVSCKSLLQPPGPRTFRGGSQLGVFHLALKKVTLGQLCVVKLGP